jgi:hypothetical protein
MRRFILWLFAASVLLAQAGCGGGGGSGSTGPQSSVSGTAAKGVIKNGTVKIYALNADGSRGRLLATTSTDDNGKYSKSLGVYSGPVIAYAFGGYTDEATGEPVTLSEANALRAALPMASGAVTLPITGLTELAVRKAGSQLTASAISNANALVSSVFKVDIMGSVPIEATAAAMNATGVTTNQLDYTLALAGLSQLAAQSPGATPSDRLESALATLSQGITTAMNSQTAQAYTDALNSYLENNGSINTIISSKGGSPVITAGSQQAVITLSLSGAGSNLYGVDLNLNLPAGVTVKAKADGTVCNAVLGLTTSTSGAYILGKLTPSSASSGAVLTLGLVSAGAIPDGSFLVINATLAAGTKVTKDSFSIADSSFNDQNGGKLAGAVLSVVDVTLK